MFARRLSKAALTPSTFVRPFSCSTPLARTPALSDINSEGAASFESKQRKFRERLAEASKKASSG
ncbi:unnamed protein product, partial [Diplocarpon coronariae]